MVNIKLNKPKVDFSGKRLHIVFMPDADTTTKELHDEHGVNVVSHLARLDRLLKRLAESGRLKSPDEFREETPGFYAVRALPLRAYGWFEPGCFVVSHLVWKKTQKLSEADKRKMNRNKDDYIRPSEIPVVSKIPLKILR